MIWNVESTPCIYRILHIHVKEYNVGDREFLGGCDLEDPGKTNSPPENSRMGAQRVSQDALEGE